MKKKYQIFISSTYLDLKEERQAAVEAVLLAGHIPAGMELFSAGDESQVEVIRRWIDESDIFMLILGPRYGSIEPKSGSSYIEIEYDHAITTNRPHFSLVMSDAARKAKLASLGLDSTADIFADKLRVFEEKVLTKISRSFEDHKDIKLFTFEAIRRLEERYSLIGWVKGNESVDAPPLIAQIASLTATNEGLQRELSELKRESASRPPLSSELKERIEIRALCKPKEKSAWEKRSFTHTWGRIFALLAPKLLEHPNDETVKAYLTQAVFGDNGDVDNYAEKMDEEVYQEIRVKLSALGLVQLDLIEEANGHRAPLWKLAPEGERALYGSQPSKK